MPDALIGSTGFVGGNLLRQARFDDLYHSRNVADAHGRCYDTLVCAGARAEKWKANQDPEGDRRGLQSLFDALDNVTARQVVLISTVDVYPKPVGVNEQSEIDPAQATAYGRHRYELEQFVRERFDTALVVRLPGLFGPGLRKNVIFDLLHNNQVEKIHPGGVYQYYNLDRLWDDIQTALRYGLRTVNFATEPVSTGELAEAAFGRALPAPAAPAARYDFYSRYAALFGGRDGYLYDKRQVLADLSQFVASESQRRAA
jgi:nucleoside-diphosphate-sugar epimerase